MALENHLRIDLIPPGGLAEAVGLVSASADLINSVYKDAEEGLWAEGADRTNLREVDGFARAGEIAVARYGEELVGCVRIQQLNDRLGEFGMLAVLPEQRGAGVGGELVRFAERHCSQAGLKIMQLELLTPRVWIHPFKTYLAEWYARIGYQVVRMGSVEESYPDLAPYLVTPCDFVVYHKEL